MGDDIFSWIISTFLIMICFACSRPCEKKCAGNSSLIVTQLVLGRCCEFRNDARESTIFGTQSFVLGSELLHLLCMNNEKKLRFKPCMTDLLVMRNHIGDR